MSIACKYMAIQAGGAAPPILLQPSPIKHTYDAWSRPAGGLFLRDQEHGELSGLFLLALKTEFLQFATTAVAPSDFVALYCRV